VGISAKSLQKLQKLHLLKERSGNEQQHSMYHEEQYQ